METQPQYRMWKRKKQWVNGTRTTAGTMLVTSLQPESRVEAFAGAIARCLMMAIMFIAAAGATVTATAAMTMNAAAMAAHSPTLSDGPSPTAQTTANMPQSGLTVHYNRVFMKFLYERLGKLLMCTHMDMPEKSGLTLRNYMNQPLGADLVQQTQGTVGPPEQVSTNFKDIVLTQLANYTNISDLAQLTSISDDMQNNKRVLAYQLGLSIDDYIMAMFDSLRTFDSRTANQDSLISPYPFTKNIIEQMPSSLGGADVPEMMDGFYNGSIHDFFVGDLSLDNSNNSIVDIWKHTDAGQVKLEELPGGTYSGEAGQVRIIELLGMHWRKSQNQTQTANWQGSGQTGISTYGAGQDAVLFINFPNSKHTKLVGNWENLDLWAGEYPRSAYDANNVIAAGTGYNSIFGTGLPPDNATSRARIAIAVPQTT
jgi:hypothetical protein